jgi:hypothetical protein
MIKKFELLKIGEGRVTFSISGIGNVTKALSWIEILCSTPFRKKERKISRQVKE